MSLLTYFKHNLTLNNIVVFLAIIIFGSLMKKFGVPWICRFILSKMSSDRLSYKFLEAFAKPIGTIILTVSIYTALTLLVDPKWPYWFIAERLLHSIIIIVIAIGAYVMCAASSQFFEGVAVSIGIEKNHIVLPLISRIVRVIVVIVMITILIAEWGYSINGIIAGLGLGSLALALAAKDTLSDLLAGIIIVTEKPFAKGDWILTPSVEGFVEDITFRSSRIRTFADALVIVPNRTISEQPITNWSKMGRRRITYRLSVTLDTDLKALERAVVRMENALRVRDDIDERMIMVRFDEIKDGSLNILLYYFSKTTVWAEHLLVRQQTMISMIEILKEEKVKLAYPVSRILVDHQQQNESEI